MRYFVICLLFPVFYIAMSRGNETNGAFPTRYSAEVKEMLVLYEQVKIVAKVTELSAGENLVYNTELIEKQKSIKSISSYISGIKRHFGNDNTIIDVATPEKTFTLRRHAADGDPHLTFLGQSGTDYDYMRGRTERLCMMIRATHSFFGIPLEQFLNRSETTLKDVNEENVGNEKMIRIQTYTLPYNEGFRKSGHHAEGSFLLDPALHLALRTFDVKYWKKDGKQLWYQLRGRMEYKKIPVARLC